MKNNYVCDMMNKKKYGKFLIALSSLEKLSTIKSEILDDSSKTLNQDVDFDAIIKIQVGANSINLYAEEKSEVREFSGLWVKLLLKYKSPENLKNVIVISSYFHPKVREELRSHGVNYLEVSGNCLIRSEGVFVFIDGQKSHEGRVKTENRSFNNSGLKLLLAILLKSDLLTTNYRSMADASNIAIGGVGWVLKDLIEQGYIEEIKKKKQLTNQFELFERWAALYPLKLKHKNMVGRYKCIDEKLRFNKKEKWFLSAVDRDEKIDKVKAYTFYTWVQPKALKKVFGLVKDDKGDIEVVTPFWAENEDVIASDRRVNELLNYADRISHPTKRKLNANEIININNTLKTKLNEEN